MNLNEKYKIVGDRLSEKMFSGSAQFLSSTTEFIRHSQSSTKKKKNTIFFGLSRNDEKKREETEKISCRIIISLSVSALRHS